MDKNFDSDRQSEIIFDLLGKMTIFSISKFIS